MPMKFDEKPRKTAIKEDEWNAGLADLPEITGILRRGGDDEAIEPVSKHVLNLVLLERGIALGR